MNKTESLQLKGIAILMMLFLHLFNTADRVELCNLSIYFWNGKPLVLAMSRVAAFCVPIYLFISGYGLTCSYKKTPQNLHPIQRIFKLYTIFWITFLIFIPLGHFLKPDFYIIDPHTLITNFLAIQYNYNHEWWFLFPYFLLVLSFRFFIHIITHSTYKNNIILIIFLTILHFTHGYIISKLGPFYIKHIVSGYLVCIYPFTLGIIFSYYDLFNKSKQYLSSHIPTHKNTILSITLIVLCICRMMLGPSIINPLFIIPFFIIYLNINIPHFICKVLEFFGIHSTNMWLTHTFFAYYLFSDFIYGLQYPLLIYLTLIIVSLISSYIIKGIHFIIYNHIKLYLRTFLN